MKRRIAAVAVVFAVVGIPTASASASPRHHHARCHCTWGTTRTHSGVHVPFRARWDWLSR